LGRWACYWFVLLPELKTPIPGPRSLALAERLRAHESRNVTFTSPEFPIFWERAEGTNVWDSDGNRFVDLTSAFAVAGLGHGNADLRGAMHAQVDTLVHGMGDVHPTELKVQLCERLSELTYERWGLGDAKTVLCNSGFEAVEAALKTALLRSGKPGVLSFTGGYHGLGYGTLMAGAFDKFREPFARQLADLGTVVPLDLAAAESALAAGEIGAILIEPIQGRGGKIVPPDGFLQGLRDLADQHGALLIFDEIYTGLNRTGKLFACEHWGVYPDLICVGKALTGGFPLSACIGAAEVMDAWPPSTGEAIHTSTFLGNPLGCRMALESLAIHERPETAAGVVERGQRLSERLRAATGAEVRGLGLMLGLEVGAGNGAAMMLSALRDGIVLLADGPVGEILSFSPPFAISNEEIDFVVARVQEYFTSLPGSSS
jgi:acetylornithine/succinyldiaminopimelate/putrescine aminotransferase